MNKKYKNLVFTDHALHRVSQRSLRKESIYQAVNDPERKYSQEEDKVKIVKTVNDRDYHIVAKPMGPNEWLIVSVWVRGEEDPIPLAWKIISFPFKLIWWLLKNVFLFLTKEKENK